MQRDQAIASRVLTYVVRSWFAVTFIGQLIFASYVLMLYWRSVATGQFDKWNTANPHFYVAGDITGNIIFGLHVALAAIITIVGPLQLVPAIRNKYPRYHRISGRIYIFSAFLISTAGLYLTWVRGAIGGPMAGVLISANAVIIIMSAVYAIRHAMRRNIQKHREWAVHLYVAMSGVWFFRVFFMLWMLIHRAPVGFDPETFTGPFLIALGVFVYLFPQAVVAAYFQAHHSEQPPKKWAFSAFLLLLTVGTAVGALGATMGMWLPRM